MTAGRALEPEEIELTHLAFMAAFGRDELAYDRVRVFRRKYVFCQGARYTVAPDGNIYCPFDPGNFATCGASIAQQRKSRALLVHEMTHVLQFQQGVNVIATALPLQILKFGTFCAYDPYAIPTGRPYESLNVEQQAEYVASQLFPECVRYR